MEGSDAAAAVTSAAYNSGNATSKPKRKHPRKTAKDAAPDTLSSSGGSSDRKPIAKPPRNAIKKKAATSDDATTANNDAARPRASPLPSPENVLIVDTGGHSIKYGWASAATANPCHIMPNVTARLQQQWTVLAGDQVQQIQAKNPHSLQHVTRSMERGIITNLGNQVQVWKRMLDTLHVSVPLTTDTAKAFGWNSKTMAAATSARKNSELNKTSMTASSTCAVILTVPPFCPRLILDQILVVWLDDFGFGSVTLCLAPVVAATLHDKYETACVIDIGWSATHIVPIVQGQPLATAIRRLPMGARHLIGLLQYQLSYRQYNLMDQDWLLEQVLRKLCFVSLDFEHDLGVARLRPRGQRPYDREFVLPNFVDRQVGEVRVPVAVQKQEESGNGQDENDDDDDENDESVREEDMQVNDDVDDDDDDDDDGGSSVDDDDEESPEQRRKRLLRERQLEQQRKLRDTLEADEQALLLSVERFTVPESLFRPTDVGMPSEWAPLPEAIIQAIDACPEVFQPAMYLSLQMVGGLAQMPGLRERLHREVRELAPDQYTVAFIDGREGDSSVQAWQGARELVLNSSELMAVNRTTWEAAASKHGMWKCFALADV